jgi:glycosyltransferase involved in cell wall biosynthesis
MRFLIATGIYPPEIGGPAYYAKNLAEALQAKGHSVEIGTFGALKKLPTGIRHVALFLRLLPVTSRIDVVIALDTFSAAVPAYFAATLFRKPMIVRTGGDFLWEQYVERSRHLVPLPFFYDVHEPFTRLERAYFAITKFFLPKTFVVFSTNFQKKIWMPIYNLDEARTQVIPNAIAGPLASVKPQRKNFLTYGRDIVLRNRSKLREAFAIAKESAPDVELDIGQVPQHILFDRIREGYCMMLPSISDISPNYILDGLRAGKPFILTKYSEYAETYPDLGLFVDPLDPKDIAAKIVQMSHKKTYDTFVKRIKEKPLTRTYADLAEDFTRLAEEVLRTRA